MAALASRSTRCPRRCSLSPSSTASFSLFSVTLREGTCWRPLLREPFTGGAGAPSASVSMSESQPTPGSGGSPHPSMCSAVVLLRSSSTLNTPRPGSGSSSVASAAGAGGGSFSPLPCADRAGGWGEDAHPAPPGPNGTGDSGGAPAEEGELPCATLECAPTRLGGWFSESFSSAGDVKGDLLPEKERKFRRLSLGYGIPAARGGQSVASDRWPEI